MDKAFKIAIVVIAACLVVFIALWFCFLRPTVKPITPQHYTVQIVDSAQGSDTIQALNSRQFIEHQLDSIGAIVQRIDNQYQQDIDTMINKSNAWIGFWLTLMSVLVGIIAFFSWYKNSKYTEEFNKLKGDLNSEKDNYHQQQGILLEKEENLQKEREAFEDDKHREIDKIKEMARLSSLSECLINMPDPTYLAKEEDRNDQVVYMLEGIQKSFSSLIYLIQKSRDSEKDYRNNTYSIVMILTDIKTAVLNSQRIFSRLNENIAFYTLLQDLSNQIMSLRKTGFVSYSDITKLEKINNSFAELISECKRSQN